MQNTEYAHLEELKAGLESSKRITDKVNEEQRRAENRATVKNLEGRVEDWKGHHISNFGNLLLDDIFTVTKSDMDREYHVFLFEKIILCCKEYTPSVNGKKVGKSNSILKKQGSPSPLNLVGPSGNKKKSTPLLLKGRIFLNNVTSATPKMQGGVYMRLLKSPLPTMTDRVPSHVQARTPWLYTGRAMMTSNTLLYVAVMKNNFVSGKLP